MNFIEKSRAYVAEKIGQSSRTKLIVTLAAMAFVYGAAIPDADKAKWLVVSGGLFVLSQGFAEGLSKKYAPKD